MMSRARHLGLGPRLSLRRFPGFLAAVTGPLAARAMRRRQVQALARLDDRLLSDIGITRAEALQETGPQDWDAPLHWVHRA